MRGLPVLVLAGLLLPACHDDDGGDGGAAPDARLLAEAELGPAGGVVEVTSGPFAGTAVALPAGALASPTRVALRTSPDGLPPAIYAFEVEPAGAALLLPARVTLAYSEDYPRDFLLPAATPMVPVSIGGALGGEIYEAAAQDVDARLVSFDTARLGRFSALLRPALATHWRLLGQDRAVAVEALVRNVGGEDLVVSGARPGATPVVVGKGSLDAFWTGSNRLILVHSTADDARQFVGDEDLIAGLDASYEGIATFQFRSGRPIGENADWLYNEIKLRAGPGFRCDLLGYSMGGLVARYALERSAADPARAELPNFDAARSAGPLSGQVRNLFTLGAPHRGAGQPELLQLSGLSSLLSSDVVQTYAPGLRDLSSGPEGVGPSLNAAFVNDPAIRYFLVAGSSNDGPLSPLIPGDDDGLVAVESALGVPGLLAPETALVFPPAGTPGFVFTHANLHAEAVPNGVRDQIVAWIAAP
jgi:hypothetical protein